MAMSAIFDVDVEAVELSADEGRALFNRRCRKLLHVSGDEFLDAYDRGVAWDRWDVDKVIELSMLIPFAR
mgnify:CR=1 FL=1